MTPIRRLVGLTMPRWALVVDVLTMAGERDHWRRRAEMAERAAAAAIAGLRAERLLPADLAAFVERVGWAHTDDQWFVLSVGPAPCPECRPVYLGPPTWASESEADEVSDYPDDSQG